MVDGGVWEEGGEVVEACARPGHILARQKGCTVVLYCITCASTAYLVHEACDAGDACLPLLLEVQRVLCPGHAWCGASCDVRDGRSILHGCCRLLLRARGGPRHCHTDGWSRMWMWSHQRRVTVGLVVTRHTI